MKNETVNPNTGLWEEAKPLPYYGWRQLWGGLMDILREFVRSVGKKGV